MFLKCRGLPKFRTKNNAHSLKISTYSWLASSTYLNAESVRRCYALSQSVTSQEKHKGKAFPLYFYFSFFYFLWNIYECYFKMWYVFTSIECLVLGHFRGPHQRVCKGELLVTGSTHIWKDIYQYFEKAKQEWTGM